MKCAFKIQKLSIIFFFVVNNSYAFDKISLTDPSILFSVSDKTVPIVSVNYVGWEAGWKWTGTKITPHYLVENSNVSGSFTGQVSKLGINFTGSVTPLPLSNQIEWTYNWRFSQNHPNALGNGLEFNLNTNSTTFLTSASVPELLPENQGWRWVTPEGTIEVKFTPALANLYFEGKKQNKIRAMFFTATSAGSKLPPTTMTVTVDQKIALSPPVGLNYENSNPALWSQAVLDDTASPVDLSFLNKDLNGVTQPAGSHGRVTAKGDQLVFEDGTVAKFWGANLQARALFSTSTENIHVHAKRIAKLGFNLVRIHHHDSKWVSPNIFKPVGNTLELSTTALDKLDQWIKYLEAEGVYVWLDLHVGRAFTNTDGIDNFNDFAKGKKKAEAKGFNYYNTSIQDRMQQFNEAYLSHVNSHTGMAYKNDPAIIGLLLTNENDLTNHFGNALLGNKHVPLHNALYKQDTKAFATKYGLPLNKTMASWVLGESKLYLNDVEHRFNQKMLNHLDLLGVHSLVATTSSWGRMGLYSLASLTDGAVIDAHSYGREEEFDYNPRYNPGFLSWIAGTQVSDKPLTVTEWNIEPFPARDRFTAPLFTASVASLQGWDAMMLYGYSQTELNGNTLTGSNYSAFNDPAIMGLMPAAALLYRQGHVAPAAQSYELKLGRNDFFFKKIDPTTSKTIRTLLETSRLTIAMPTNTPELPWLKNNVASSNAIADPNKHIITDPNRDFIIPVPGEQNVVMSDTSELKRDWGAGVHTVNTEKSQIASGWIGGKAFALNDVVFNVTTKKAVVAVQSMENTSIALSKKIFITAMARCQPSIDKFLPFLCEPMAGTVTVKALPGLALYSVTHTGTEVPKLAAASFNELDGKYTIDLQAAEGHWLILK
ncbi:cellulase family glycosylhydrolase [Methyloglobulus sp.]|uniref:cellulase family glycosylhydrolase n=1 Tax=Methyloglobulus sp. TaxID=2518622 RepID=UPI0032B84A44